MNFSAHFYEENGLRFPKREVPNASAVLALGIISIPLCFCYGILGIICSIIALVLYAEADKVVKRNPNHYDFSSYENLKTGRICAIVGLCFSIAYLFLVVFFYVFFIFGLLLYK